VRDFSITDVQPYAITLSWTAGLEDDSEMEVFTKNHAVPFSKMLTFHRKEPFCLDARYTTVQDLPYNCAQIGEWLSGLCVELGYPQPLSLKFKSLIVRRFTAVVQL
jgi:hypothetical protein